MICAMGALLMLSLGEMPTDAVHIEASIPATTLETGTEYEILLNIKFGDGSAASNAGMDAPILQIDVPKSAKLLGKTLSSMDELKRNEFFRAPYERELDGGTEHIKFELKKKPKDGEAFYLNIAAYVTIGEDDPYFLRRRIEVPLTGGAEGVEVSADTSDWGPKKFKQLQIGDKAPKFKLPSASGEKVSLKDYLGEKNVIVTTYRAHW